MAQFSFGIGGCARRGIYVYFCEHCRNHHYLFPAYCRRRIYLYRCCRSYSRTSQDKRGQTFNAPASRHSYGSTHGDRSGTFGIVGWLVYNAYMISIFLAKVLGIYLILVCLAVLMKRRSLGSAIIDLDKNPLFIYFSGALILILGLVMVNLHNIWMADYRVVITILGWLTVLKGVARLFFADKIVSIGQSVFNSRFFTPLIVIFLIVGIWLTSKGFGVV